jgi:hypothetical protein
MLSFRIATYRMTEHRNYMTPEAIVNNCSKS